MPSFLIPSAEHEVTLEIKKSRFIALIEHTRGVEAAQQFVEDIRGRYPDANHHCYAYVAGAPDDIYQVDKSDDGEPRGTAGKPMLNVLQHSGLGEACVVVVRYFGGVKLGAGGLVRAYTQSVSAALADLPTSEFVSRTELIVTLPYTMLGSVEHWVSNSSSKLVDKQFDSEVHVTLGVPEDELRDVSKALIELGQGAIRCKTRDEG